MFLPQLNSNTYNYGHNYVHLSHFLHTCVRMCSSHDAVQSHNYVCMCTYFTGHTYIATYIAVFPFSDFLHVVISNLHN